MANRAVVWRVGSASALDATELEVREKPKASPGHVVVRMTTRNFLVEEFFTLENLQSSGESCEKKIVVGYEGCGVVEEIGEGVSKVHKVGVRVIPFLSELREGSWHGEGSWQDYIKIPEEHLFLVPDTLPTEVAAQLMNCWTAYDLLKDLNLPKGEYLLQTAAGSTVGRLVIRLARHWGLKTINVVRRDEVKQELKDLGGDEVINFTTEGNLCILCCVLFVLEGLLQATHRPEGAVCVKVPEHTSSNPSKDEFPTDLVTRVKEITGGKGAYVGIDYVGGPVSKLVGSCVRDGGQSLVLGTLESKDFTISFDDLCRGIQVKAWGTSPPSSDSDKDQRDKEVGEVIKLFEENVFKIRAIWKRFPLENYKEAILEAQRDHGRHGTILLTS